MLKVDAEQLLTKIAELWPRWEPTDAELAEWLSQIGTFDNPDRFRAAISDHFASSRWARPTLAGIIECINIRTPGDSQAHEATPYFAGVALQCVEHSKKVGHYIPLWFRNQEGAPDQDAILRTADRERQRAEKVYGGKWRVLQGVTLDDLEAARRRGRRGVALA